MSVIAVLIYAQGGLHTNPGVIGTFDTNCLDGLVTLQKDFSEVFIHWNGTTWIEDPVYLPGQSIVALKVTNQCAGTTEFIKMGANDYRAAINCCFDCPVPYGVLSMADAVEGVPYSHIIQLLGNGAFSMTIVDKPAWMTIVMNATGEITFAGTPVGLTGSFPVSVLVNNCSKPNASGKLLEEDMN